MVVFWAFGSAAVAENGTLAPILHPQSLEQAGIYAVREIDPDLTGDGVNFAVICRSFSYIGDKLQNDYRPATEHACLELARLSFHDNAEPPGGVSPHATAICSILFGEHTLRRGYNCVSSGFGAIHL